jgi:hypothetical protein
MSLTKFPVKSDPFADMDMSGDEAHIVWLSPEGAI